MKCYILRYSEIALKGKNRKYFEQKLIQNCKTIDKDLQYERHFGRIILFSEKDILNKLKKISGLSSISIAIKIPLDIEIIKEEVFTQIEKKEFTTFRISCQRLNKEFKTTSQEINEIIGESVHEKFKKRVSLKKPDLDIGIEILDQSYLFFETEKCIGGLPLGSQGRVACFLEDEESLAAATLIMKRGCTVLPISTNNYVVPQGIFKKEPIFAKDFKEAEEICTKYRINTIVLNDRLNKIREFKTDKLILRPLITFTDIEIKKIIDLVKE